MNRIRQPFNVNSLAQVAALAALDDDAHVLECVRMIEAGRHYLYDEFKSVGLQYVPSRANFILVDVGRSAADIYQKLLHKGVIVRPMTPFGLETALRITVGTPEENRKLVKALRAVLGKPPRDPATRDRRRRPARRLRGESGAARRARPPHPRDRPQRRADAAGADDGTLDLAVTDLDAGVREADFVLLAAPVLAIEGLLERVWRGRRAGALVTDVGSTKRNIVRAAERLAATRPLGFVGSHPLAGSEKSGYHVARADLFRGATVV